MGDKVLLKDNFPSSNIFAKADWTPVKVTEIFPSSDGAIRTVMVQKENGDEQTLTTDKLAIVEEDLLERYKKFQGLQTVNCHEDGSGENDEENPSTAGREGLQASLQSDTSGDHGSSAHTTPPASNARALTEEMASAGRRRGRPRGAKNLNWQADPTRYGFRSLTTIDNNI